MNPTLSKANKRIEKLEKALKKIANAGNDCGCPRCNGSCKEPAALLSVIEAMQELANNALTKELEPWNKKKP